MATAAPVSEIQSLNQINYKSKIKALLLIVILFCLFVMGFLNFYPFGDKIKSVIRTTLGAQGCNPDFDEMRVEWFMPKLVVSNLNIPANCLNRAGDPLNFNHLTIKYQLISFIPFGIPLKVETEFSGQPLEFYIVQGLPNRTLRMKDQTINLAKLKSFIGDQVKIDGNVVIDLTATLGNKLEKFNLFVQSKNVALPSQNIQGFTTPPLKLNELFIEAVSEIPPTIQINKFILGDSNAPIRANFRGKISLMEGNPMMSPLDLAGEVAFSESFKDTLPLIDMIFQSFTQKDGFYQIQLGGTLGQPKPLQP